MINNSMKITDIITEGEVDNTFMRKRQRKVKFDQEKKAAPFGRDEVTGQPLSDPKEREYDKTSSYVIVGDDGKAYAEIPIPDDKDLKSKQAAWIQADKKSKEMQLKHRKKFHVQQM